MSRAYQDAQGTARTTTYTYPAGTRDWTAADTAGTISVTADRLGRPTQVTVSGDTGATTTFGYSHTAPTRTDPSGAYTMTIDKGGRVTAIDDPLHAANWTFAYGANGELVSTGWPTTTALATTSGYDALGRLVSRTTTPGPRASYTQAYNRAGKRLTEASTVTGDPANGTAVTGYDPLGRLTAYSLPGIRTLGAGFDAVPNRTSLTTDGVPLAATFDQANRPTSGGYAADADGRVTARPGQTLLYDSLGRLAEVRTSPGDVLLARYGYDALDRLFTIERPGQVTIRFRYVGTTTAVATVVEDGVGVLRHVTVGPEGTVLQDWLGTDQRHYGTNGHHDTTFTTDGAGTVTATLRYDPWGTLLRSTGSLPDWRFQGSWADAVTGLAWSIARWYDPASGTFTSEDTLLGDPASPASRHLYAYAGGDPVGGWDPDGHEDRRITVTATQRSNGWRIPKVTSKFYNPWLGGNPVVEVGWYGRFTEEPRAGRPTRRELVYAVPWWIVTASPAYGVRFNASWTIQLPGGGTHLLHVIRGAEGLGGVRQPGLCECHRSLRLSGRITRIIIDTSVVTWLPAADANAEIARRNKLEILVRYPARVQR